MLSLVGLTLIVLGFYKLHLHPGKNPILWDPPTWTRHMALALMLPAMIALVATYVPSHIHVMLKHPMLVAIKIWALAHLLANGDLASLLLFGSFLAFAVYDRISVKRRGDLGPIGRAAGRGSTTSSSSCSASRSTPRSCSTCISWSSASRRWHDAARAADRHSVAAGAAGADADARPRRDQSGGRRRRRSQGRQVQAAAVTILAREDWEAALAVLGDAAATAVDWTARRANLLVEHVRLPRALGAMLRIGPALLEVTYPTTPCARMDEACPGLAQGAAPEWRGGVTCRVLEGGGVAIGDAVEIVRRRPSVRKLPVAEADTGPRAGASPGHATSSLVVAGLGAVGTAAPGLDDELGAGARLTAEAVVGDDERRAGLHQFGQLLGVSLGISMRSRAVAASASWPAG